MITGSGGPPLRAGGDIGFVTDRNFELFELYLLASELTMDMREGIRSLSSLVVFFCLHVRAL